jgi:hypothetical protein
MYAVYRTTNTIILYLILSNISIFIPVSGGVGRGQAHCFAQGGGNLKRNKKINKINKLILLLSVSFTYFSIYRGSSSLFSLS